ncbi:MAG TPA: DUF2306 domain-containing protein [Anaerolineae bacterium]|nr:DUF2306 domain-containing protein [Anaerolineae bacterium]
MRPTVQHRLIGRSPALTGSRWAAGVCSASERYLVDIVSSQAAVALRIYLPICLAAGFPYRDAYQVISWFCWVSNLVVAEWLLLGRWGGKLKAGTVEPVMMQDLLTGRTRLL